MPAIASRCYLVSEGTSWIAFVPAIGGYLKTHWCVVVTECPACQAMPGEPCSGTNRNGRNSQISSTHYVRRQAAAMMKNDPKVRRSLTRAMPAIAFALDALAEAFAPKRAKKIVRVR